jgi:inhibitor of cysteine peptidase
LRVISHQYVAPKTRMMGAPGYEIWRFKVLPEAYVVPRVATIAFVYARSWQSAPFQSLKLTVFALPRDDS